MLCENTHTHLDLQKNQIFVAIVYILLLLFVLVIGIVIIILIKLCHHLFYIFFKLLKYPMKTSLKIFYSFFCLYLKCLNVYCTINMVMPSFFERSCFLCNYI